MRLLFRIELASSLELAGLSSASPCTHCEAKGWSSQVKPLTCLAIMDDEIRIRHHQMEDIWEDCQEVLKKFDKASDKMYVLDQLNSKAEDFESAWDNYKIELAGLKSELRSEYQKHGQTHRKRLRDLKTDIAWKKTAASKDDLFSDLSLPAGPDMNTREGLQQHAEETLQDSKSSLQNTLSTVNKTVVVGRDVSNKLDEQTEQLQAVFDELTEMGQVLDRSKRVMKKMARMMATDKYLWCLVGTVFIGIIGIIGYEIATGGSDPVRDQVNANDGN
jgi:hypothetical protein